VCTKFGQNPLKDVDSRVFTGMLCGKNLTRWPWPLTLKINRVPDSPKDYVCTKFGQNPLKDVDSRVFTKMLCRVSVWRRSWADNLRIWQEIIWHCCQNDRLFQNKWPKRPTHATYVSDMWSSILQFVHNLFWLKLKWNARSKLFYCIIYRSSMLWWSSRTLTKLKLQSQKRFNERKYKIFEI
jgi:hypothetical protein